MGAIVRLNEDDLILVRVIQRSFFVLLDRDVEDGLIRLHLSDESRVLAIVSCDDICASEPVLRAAPSWDEDGAIVDGDRDRLFPRQRM